MKVFMMKKLYWGLIISVLSAGSAFADCNDYNQLFNLIAKRTSYMQTVAANKYLATPQGNIYDAPQELKVLQNAQMQAHNQQLESNVFLPFTQTQMDLSKQIQAYWFSYWQQNPQLAPKPRQYADLATVRQQIKIIDDQLYPQLAKLITTNPECPLNQLNTKFAAQFAEIKGIPHNPDFRSLVVASVIATVHSQH